MLFRSKIERTTYRDQNLITGDLTVTIITKTTVTKDGTTTVTYTKDVKVTDTAGNVTETKTGPQAEELFPDTVDPDTAEKTETGDKLIDLAFAYGQDVGVTISYLYIPAGEDGEGNATAPTYVITITNPGTTPITVKAILTEKGAASGITFVIQDGTEGSEGTTLQNNTQAQMVTIAVSQAPSDTPQDSPSTDE